MTVAPTSERRSAFDHVQQAVRDLRAAATALADASDAAASDRDADRRLLATARTVERLANDLEATCTRCGTRPTDYGFCACALD
jgi:hypothetical protein